MAALAVGSLFKLAPHRLPPWRCGVLFRGGCVGKLSQLPPRFAGAARRVTALPKRADRFYQSKEWRSLVARLKRERGAYCRRCGAGGRGVRIIGDHIHEIKDGGAKLDERNIELLCSPCHNVKTAQERRRRVRRGEV